MTRLSVLLVRPVQEQDELVKLLEQAGTQVYRCPVMDIEPVLSPEAKSRVLDFDHYQIAIFVSRVAARLGMDWLENYWPELPMGIRYYAVGKATAAALAERGVHAELPRAGFNSEALLAMPSLRSIAGQKALIFAGQGGRTLLAQELQRRGAKVDRCELYRRCAIGEHAVKIASLLAQSKLDLVAAHSGELVHNLLAVVPQALHETLHRLPIIVPGERVATIATDLSFSQVLKAPSAAPEDMVSTILEWYSNKKI
ncbi:uroporphyrinogen-III synthase [Porticoccus sp.]|uniref:uroporphyrinogen-III synthase n=1 Tax=Porticoccus sp. TaxID=2024853 RepID=UPI003F69EF11